jgi:predicted ATPase
MITQLRAKNFKSWKDTGELPLAPLTGLFGTNSSGKTSIMQILLMLKQTVESPDRKRVLHTGDHRSLVDLGTFFDLIHSHRPDVVLELSLSWNLPAPLVINDPEKKRTQLYNIEALSFMTKIREESNRAVVESFAYEFGDHSFGMIRKNSDKNADKDRYDLLHKGYNVKRVPGRAWPLSAPVKCYGFPDEATGYYQNTGFLPDFVLAFEGLFSRIAYLGPLREYPQRSYVWAGESPVDVGRKGELAVPALLASRGKKTISRGPGRGKSKQTVEERIALWLSEMGMIDSFSLRPIAENRKDYEVRVKKTATSPEVLITDVGFGVSQILPVLVLCYYVPEGSIILLEQPEIHLHPLVQSALADVLIDVVNKRSVQIIVESHSEHLLRRLQRRMAEAVIGADKVALYFCAMDDAVSRIDKLKVNLFGSITNWPAEFFGDEMGDLIAMSEAAMKRQGANR